MKCSILRDTSNNWYGCIDIPFGDIYTIMNNPKHDMRKCLPFYEIKSPNEIRVFSDGASHVLPFNNTYKHTEFSSSLYDIVTREHIEYIINSFVDRLILVCENYTTFTKLYTLLHDKGVDCTFNKDGELFISTTSSLSSLRRGVLISRVTHIIDASSTISYTCPGCLMNAPGQRAHMDKDGCLYDEP